MRKSFRGFSPVSRLMPPDLPILHALILEPMDRRREQRRRDVTLDRRHGDRVTGIAGEGSVVRDLTLARGNVAGRGSGAYFTAKASLVNCRVTGCDKPKGVFRWDGAVENCTLIVNFHIGAVEYRQIAGMTIFVR